MDWMEGGLNSISRKSRAGERKREAEEVIERAWLHKHKRRELIAIYG